MKRKSKEKQPSLPSSKDWSPFFLSVLCGIMVFAHLAASFFPKGRIWGINQWSYFSPAVSLIAGIFVLLFLIPSLNELVRRGISSFASPALSFLPNIRFLGKKRKYLLYFLLSFPFLIPFWFLKDRTHLLGDGAQIISYMNSGELPIKWSEPLETLLHLKVFDLAHKFWQMDSAQVYTILSCLAGVTFVFMVFLFADFWGKGLCLSSYAAIIGFLPRNPCRFRKDRSAPRTPLDYPLSY